MWILEVKITYTNNDTLPIISCSKLCSKKILQIVWSWEGILQNGYGPMLGQFEGFYKNDPQSTSAVIIDCTWSGFAFMKSTQITFHINFWQTADYLFWKVSLCRRCNSTSGVSSTSGIVTGCVDLHLIDLFDYLLVWWWLQNKNVCQIFLNTLIVSVNEYIPFFHMRFPMLVATHSDTAVISPHCCGCIKIKLNQRRIPVLAHLSWNQFICSPGRLSVRRLKH